MKTRTTPLVDSGQARERRRRRSGSRVEQGAEAGTLSSGHCAACGEVFVTPGHECPGSPELSLRCLESGEYFRVLGSHLWNRHHLSGREYKDRHALPEGARLMSLELRAMLSGTAKRLGAGSSKERMAEMRD